MNNQQVTYFISCVGAERRKDHQRRQAALNYMPVFTEQSPGGHKQFCMHIEGTKSEYLLSARKS